MPTVEHRRNSEGRVVALRVKVRKAGQPHLSKTFTVAGRGAAALHGAELAASEWLAQLGGRRRTTERRSALTAQWQQAITDERTASTARTLPNDGRLPPWPVPTPADLAAAERALSSADSSASRALLHFLLSTGQPWAVAERLRWQQIDLALRRFDVLSLTGQTLRQVPLPALALDALLSMHRRKHGLVFAADYPVVEAAARAALSRAGLGEAAVRRIAARQLVAEGTPIDILAATMGLLDLNTPMANPQARLRGPV